MNARALLRRALPPLLAALFFTSGALAEGGAITLVSDEYPPFNHLRNKDGEGYMIDIAREIFEKEGLKVEYVSLPWTRAVNETRLGAFNAIVASTDRESVGFVMPKEELALDRSTYWVKKGDPWRFEGIASLKGLRLGVIAGYKYYDELNGYISENLLKGERVQLASGENALERNIKKLLSGHVDILVDNEYTVLAAARNIGVADRITPVGYGGKPSPLYIAFSPRRKESQALADLLDKGVREMRKSGRLQKILEKYGIRDWK